MSNIHIDHDIMMNYNENLNTICQVLREIYRLANKEGNKEIMSKCITASIMAKKMSRKLQWYHNLYVNDNQSWHKHEDIFKI